MGDIKKRVLFTSHTANFQKFNRPFMKMLRGTLDAPYSKYNIGNCIVDYASAEEEEIFDADHSFKIDFARSPFALRKHFAAYREMKSILKERPYDIIHTHTPVGSVITRLAASQYRKKGTKVIYTAHGFHFYKGAPLKNWLLWYPVEKALAKKCDLLITINDEDYTRAKNNFKTKVVKINGVGLDTNKFDLEPSEKEKLNLRKTLGLKDNDYVIIFNGEFNPDKNHRFLLTSLTPLLKKEANVKILLIGKGSLLEETKALCRKLGIEEQVIFTGYRQDIPNLLRIGNLYISPSVREGLVVSVLEAIYCKLPVLLFDNRGHRQILGNETKNLFHTEEELLKKTRAAFRKKHDYRVRYNEAFSLSSALESMKKVYEEYL
jgi:glycosyltransferase EpsD